ncbi:EamA family transporter [bacterium]|nr:EamA family transporter [bacterium]
MILQHKWIHTRLVAMSAFWGGAFVAGRIVALSTGPLTAAFLRFFCASILLGILVHVMEPGPHVRRGLRQTAGLAVLGLTGIAIYNALFFIGLKHVESARAASIIATNPIVVLVFTAVLFRERVSPIRAAGILLSVSGAIVVLSRGSLMSLFEGSMGFGELCILGCVISWAVYTVLGKRILKNISPLRAVYVTTFFGALFLFGPALKNGLIPDMLMMGPKTWLALAYLIVFPTVLGYVWFYEGVHRIGPAKASQYVNFVPVSAMFLSLLFLHEPVTLSLISGTACVIAGVMLVQRHS